MKKFLCLIMIICLTFSLSGCQTIKKLSQYMSSAPDASQNVNASNQETDKTQSNAPSQTISVPSEEPSSESISVSQPQEPPTFSIKLSFAGDTMLASYKNITDKGSFNEYSQKNTPDYFFKRVQSVFANDDFTTVNLENVFTDNDLEEAEKDHDPAYWFRSKTANTKILTSGSVEGVSVANNHTYDYGKQGYKDTINAVKAAGINYGSFEKIMYYEKNGFKIAVICYGLWHPSGIPTFKNLIKNAEKESDYQIVFFHGGTESVYVPEEWKKQACYSLVDAGADLIIGHHPHVLQPREIYKNTEIVYSLGNFCFGGNRRPGKNTIIYQMELTVDSQTLQLKAENSTIIPCYVFDGKWNNYQPCLVENAVDKKKILDFMAKKTNSPY